jgi:hypothetical protein
MESPIRPSTVEVMVLVNIIGAISILIFGTLVGSAALPLVGGSLGGSYAVVLILFAVLVAVCDIGLWLGSKWSYWLTFLICLIYFASFVLFINVIGLIVGILLIYYVTRPLVKEWLHTHTATGTTTTAT